MTNTDCERGGALTIDDLGLRIERPHPRANYGRRGRTRLVVRFLGRGGPLAIVISMSAFSKIVFMSAPATLTNVDGAS